MLATIDDVIGKEYDYIICGGGTSGLVLASRLTEDPSISVLVVEAGEANLDDPVLLRTASYGRHFGNPSYDWVHKTVPQKNVLDREFIWSRGKGLGGSSGINFYLYTKPSAHELDDLERLGNTGWNWNEVNKYMLKSERFTHPDPNVKRLQEMDLNHWKSGTDGPVLTAFPGQVFAGDLQVQKTMINAGLPKATDPLGGDPNGVFFAPSTIDPVTHTRMYAVPAYYLPHQDRKNLTVLVSTLVTSVDLEAQGDKLTATGVRVVSAGREHVVHVIKEVILAAGALKTPQILELSGIGDPEVLEMAGIPVKLALPAVGGNAQEHCYNFVTWQLKDDFAPDTLDLLRDPDIAAEHIQLHKEKAQGLFTMGMTGLAFASLDQISPNYKTLLEAVKARMVAKAESLPSGLRAQYEIMLSRLDNSVPCCEFLSYPGTTLPTSMLPDPTKKYINLGFAINHPWSRGSVHINSSDPQADPLMDPKYFEEIYDLAAFLEMAKWARKLADVEPLKSMVVKEVFPGSDVNDDISLERWLKTTFKTTWHTCGTAAMLPRDKDGVVDPQLKVYGTNNLRIVDLSVLPLHMAMHTISFVYAVAEKAAEIIQSEA